MPSNPVFTDFKTESSTDSYSLPFTGLKNKEAILSVKVAYDYPDSIISFENEGEQEIANLNKEILNEIELPNEEKFNFTGGYNNTDKGGYLNLQFQSS